MKWMSVLKRELRDYHLPKNMEDYPVVTEGEDLIPWQVELSQVLPMKMTWDLILTVVFKPNNGGGGLALHGFS